MSNVIQFPDPKSQNISVTGTGPIEWGECSEIVHYFQETPGICNCGENYWEPPNDPRKRAKLVT